MTCDEFSDAFEVLLNSHRFLNKYSEGTVSNTINLSEYEKSILLTKAQEDLIVAAYDGSNIFSDSFESSEKVRKFLNALVKTTELTSYITDEGISNKSYIFTLPEEDDLIWFTVYEEAVLADENLGSFTALVKPVTHDEYYHTQENPFKKANKKRVLRLDIANNKVELISEYTINTYKIRYISKPSPIILIDLTDYNLTINGKSEKTECVLNPAIHTAILERAVQLAYQSRAVKENE